MHLLEAGNWHFGIVILTYSEIQLKVFECNGRDIFMMKDEILQWKIPSFTDSE